MTEPFMTMFGAAVAATFAAKASTHSPRIHAHTVRERVAGPGSALRLNLSCWFLYQTDANQRIPQKVLTMS